MKVWNCCICFVQQDRFFWKVFRGSKLICLPLHHFVNENGKRSKVYKDVVMLTLQSWLQETVWFFILFDTVFVYVVFCFLCGSHLRLCLVVPYFWGPNIKCIYLSRRLKVPKMKRSSAHLGAAGQNERKKRQVKRGNCSTLFLCLLEQQLQLIVVSNFSCACAVQKRKTKTRTKKKHKKGLEVEGISIVLIIFACYCIICSSNSI